MNHTLTFQARTHDWMLECFGEKVTADIAERSHRFLEESLELVQSIGCTREEARQLVDYVFDRPAGEPGQEVGGVMLTLAALCGPAGLQMMVEGERELVRVNAPDVIEKIRMKQATKPHRSPLPGASDALSAPPPSPQLRVTNPATIDQFRRALSDHSVKLPLQLDLDASTLFDADGKAVLVVDVNRERSDEDAAWIAGMVQVAVNTCGGFIAQPATEGSGDGQ